MLIPTHLIRTIKVKWDMKTYTETFTILSDLPDTIEVDPVEEDLNLSDEGDVYDYILNTYGVAPKSWKVVPVSRKSINAWYIQDSTQKLQHQFKALADLGFRCQKTEVKTSNSLGGYDNNEVFVNFYFKKGRYTFSIHTYYNTNGINPYPEYCLKHHDSSNSYIEYIDECGSMELEWNTDFTTTRGRKIGETMVDIWNKVCPFNVSIWKPEHPESRSNMQDYYDSWNIELNK